MGYKPAGKTVNEAQTFASRFWDQTLAEAHQLFERPSLDPRSKTYMRDTKERLAAQTAMLILIRQLAQTIGGSIGQTGHNKNTDVEAAEKWIKAAELQLGVAIPRDRKAQRRLNKKGSDEEIRKAM